MLRRDGEPTPRAFADQARAARAVPADHPLLPMRRPADWGAGEAALERSDDRAPGRPSSPPALLLRLRILEPYADLSDREVHAPVGDNRLSRACVGRGADDPVPDDTTRVQFRERLGTPGLRQRFATRNAQGAAAGLRGTERRGLDGGPRWATGARRAWVSLLRQGRQVVVEAVAQGDPARATPLRATCGPPPTEPRGEGALRVESERTVAWLDAVAAVADPRVQTRVAGETDRVVSFHDPDARWGHQAPDQPVCGDTAPERLDPDSRLLTAVDVVPGNANEAVRTDALLAREVPALPAGAGVIADGLYHNATTVQQVEAAQARPGFGGLRA